MLLYISVMIFHQFSFNFIFVLVLIVTSDCFFVSDFVFYKKSNYFFMVIYFMVIFISASFLKRLARIQSFLRFTRF